MLTLVLGGSASGKSEYAENLAQAAGGRLLYVATMQPFDAECRARIARHQTLRADKGFETIECYTGLQELRLPPDATVLLECLSNLAANELYSEAGAGEHTHTAIVAGVQSLCEQARQVVVVSNEVFSDGLTYDEGTRDYLRVLAGVNCALAAQAQRVVEVVYGIPILHKTEGSAAL